MSQIIYGILESLYDEKEGWTYNPLYFSKSYEEAYSFLTDEPFIDSGRKNPNANYSVVVYRLFGQSTSNYMFIVSELNIPTSQEFALYMTSDLDDASDYMNRQTVFIDLRDTALYINKVYFDSLIFDGIINEQQIASFN
jgi:hypothetical protein